MLGQLSPTQQKMVRFALWGAAGCLFAALLGEAWLWATYQPPTVKKEPLAVCLLLDCSGSMSGRKLSEIKSAASRFAERRRDSKDQIAVVGFGSQVHATGPLTNDPSAWKSAIAALADGGSTDMAAGLNAAAAQLASSNFSSNILIFTDGQPDSQPAALQAAAGCQAKQLKIVAVVTQDVDLNYMNRLTGDATLVFPTQAGQFEQAFQQAEKQIFGQQLAESTPTSAGLGYGLLRIGTWTALLAAGIALALVAGQNHYLRRVWLRKRQGIVAGLGGLACGLLAGALGQLLFAGTTDAPDFVVALGRMLGWTVLGALVGLGLSQFVPGLPASRGLSGGTVGGVAGAIGFLVAGVLLGDVVGRLLGAALLGLCIGAMIALVEAMFREGWLEVHYGPGEVRTVSLGRKPVGIGSNPELCAVYVRGAPDVALRYAINDGRITCEDVPAERTIDVLPGDRRSVGNVSVVVCAPEPSLAGRNNMTSEKPPAAARLATASAASHGSIAQTPAEGNNAPYQLRIRGYRTPLEAGTHLTATDIAGLESERADGVVGEVTPHPQDANVLGLKNHSTRPWTAITPDGQEKSVEVGKNIRLAPGTKIRFGVLEGIVE